MSQEIFGQIGEVIRQWYWLPLLIVYVGIILTILIENRNPSKTIAWLLVIVFVPVVGVILYYLFGQKFSKVKTFQENNKLQQSRFLERWSALDPIMEANMQVLSEQIGSLSRVFGFLVNQRISPPILGNGVKLLINGEEKFPALLEAIRGARHHIHLEYYIFEPDWIGKRILDELLRKVDEGVRVRIIVDAFGSPRLSRRARKLRALGLEVAVFLPVGISSLANSNYRNHRKVVIVDGDIAFVGGINISDPYINRPDDPSATRRLGSTRRYWRDTSIKLEGSAVNVLQTYFWMDWLFAGGDHFDLNEGYLHLRPAPAKGAAAVSFTYSDPGSRAPYCMETLLVAISEAQDCIRLCTPYFIPSEQLSTALQIAAASGIRVELIMPRNADSYIVQHASLSYLKPLLERGVRVYLYERGFMHAKTVTIDGKLAFVGTVNLDTRSFYINFETAVLVSDPEFCMAMDRQFEIDIGSSHLLTLAQWRKRSRWKRGLDSLCRLLAPLL